MGDFDKESGFSFRKLPAHLILKFLLNEVQRVLYIASHSAVKWMASAAAVQGRCRPLYSEQSGDTDCSPHIEAGLKETHRKKSSSRYSWHVSIKE